MLRYFRINDPYRLISLLVLLAAASLPLLINLPEATLQELKGMVLGEVVGNKLMYVEIIDPTPPLMAVTDGMLNFMFGRSILARHILAFFVIFFQASYFGILLINNKAYNESNYVTALIFGFLCFFSFDLLATTPELLASTLLLLSLNNLFKEIEFRIDRDSIVLNLGVFLGMASLFVFSYSIFLLGTILILIIFARATLRKILLLLFGYGLVHAAVLTLYYCYDRTDDLLVHFYAASFSAPRVNYVGMNSMLILGAVPMVYFVFSLFMLTREARFTKYQSQLFQVIFLWLAVAVIQIWITPERSPHSFFSFVPPAAYFISHYLLLIRRRWRAETMLWIFILGLLSINFSSMHGLIQRVDYSALFVKPSSYAGRVANQRIMVLGDDFSPFQNNRLGGHFLDWNVSKMYFQEPGYYENLIKVNDAIMQDKPDVIIDPQGYLIPFVERIPALKKNYQKENELYRLR